MTDQYSSGEHRKVEMYGGSIEVCDTCVNVLGYNARWDQSHPATAPASQDVETGADRG